MARKNVVRRREADQDVEDQVDYYVDQGAIDTALRFLDAVDAACQRLEEQPEIGPIRKFQDHRLAGLRLWFIPDFPEHLLFYRITDETVEVVRVLP